MLKSEAVPCPLCGGDPEISIFCGACAALGFTIELEHEPLQRLAEEQSGARHDK